MIETAADRAAYLQAFGESANWTKSNATTAAVSIVLHQIYSDAGASVADYIAQTSAEAMGAVKLRETLTVNGVVYTITDIRPDNAGWIELQLDR